MAKVIITAKSMSHAQGTKLSDEVLEVLTLKADRDRKDFGETALQDVPVEVWDMRHEAMLGHITFRL